MPKQKKNKQKKDVPYSKKKKGKSKGKGQNGDARGYSTGANRDTHQTGTIKLQTVNQGTLAIRQLAWPNGIVWNAARSLCSFLLKTNMSGVESEAMVTSDSNVVEVGSGTGVVGLMAASLGASVLLTDRPVTASYNALGAADISAEVLDLLRANIKINSSLLSGPVSVEPLLWAEQEHIEQIQKKMPKIDFIVGSDCFLTSHAMPALVETLDKLSTESTKLLFSYECRSDGGQDPFFELAKMFQFNEVYRDRNIRVVMGAKIEEAIDKME